MSNTESMRFFKLKWFAQPSQKYNVPLQRWCDIKKDRAETKPKNNPKEVSESFWNPREFDLAIFNMPLQRRKRYNLL